MLKNKSYWQARFETLEKRQNRTAGATYNQIAPAFDKAQAKINKEIEHWYQRIADNNEISLADAKKLLTANELKEFKWTVEDYIKYGQENALDGAWMKELENASAKFHISRLEALKLNTQQQLEVAFGNQLDAVDAMCRKVYENGYYRTAFEIMRGNEVGFNIGKIDTRQLDKIISKPWAADGSNFSDRIWNSKTQMVTNLHQQLIRTCILGGRPDDAIKAMEAFVDKECKNAKRKAARLVQTEQAFFASEAQRDCFKDLDVEEFEFVASLDEVTCEICGGMDGHHLPMKEFEPGSTAPPLHPFCRCVTVPYFNDEWAVGERAARNEEGKTYYVPESTKYEDWKSGFVDGKADPSAVFPVISQTEKIVEKTIKENIIQLQADNFPASFNATKAEKANTQKVCDLVNGYENADPKVVEVYANMAKLENIESKGIPFAVKHNANHAVSYRYSMLRNDLTEVSISYPKITDADPTGQLCTTLHEQMHLMDMYCRENEGYSAWLSARNEKWRNIYGDLWKNHNKVSISSKGTDDGFRIGQKAKDLFAEWNNLYKTKRAELNKIRSDAISAATDKFWNKSITYKEYKSLQSKADKAFKEAIDEYGRNLLGGGVDNLMDMYDAVSGGTFRDYQKHGIVYGHGSKYYSSTANRAEETLANYGALSIVRPDLIEMFAEDYPDIIECCELTIEEMIKIAGDR